MRLATAFRTAVFAAFLLSAEAAAQSRRPIRAAEAATVEAVDLYELVEQLRPDWLWMGGDPAVPVAAARVRVFVGYADVGGVQALRGRTTSNLHSIHIAGPQRMGIPRGTDVAAVLLVRYEDPQVARAPARRFHVTVGGSRRGLLDARAEASHRDNGWPKYHLGAFTRRTRALPPVYVGVGMRLRGNTGVGANAIRARSSVRSVQREGVYGTYVTNDFTIADISATAFAGNRYVRLGVGPALRLVDYSQAGGSCMCSDVREGSQSVLGAAGDVTLSVPPSGRLQFQMIVSGRWFSSHSLPSYSGAPPVQLGGSTLYATFGAAFSL